MPYELEDFAPIPMSIRDFVPAPVNIPPEADPRLQQPSKRTDMWKQMLAGVLYSMGKGMMAGAAARPGMGPTAALGGALAAPQELTMAKQQLALEEARQRLYEGQTAERLAMLDPRVQEAITRSQYNQARAGLAGAQTGYYGARTSDIYGETVPSQARTALTQAQTERLQYIPTSMGLFDLQAGEIVPGTTDNTSIEVTPAVATSLNIPSDMIGRTATIGDLNQFSMMANRPMKITATAEGVMLLNQLTGKKEKIGDIPPPQGVGRYFPLYDDFGNYIGFINPTTGQVSMMPENLRARGAGLPMGETEKRATLGNLIENAKWLRKEVERHKESIGVFAGRFADIAQQHAPEAIADWFPNYTGEDVVYMFRVAQNMRNQLLYALSGKQINEREYARLGRLVPDPKTNYKTFTARLDVYEKELKDTLAKRKGEIPFVSDEEFQQRYDQFKDWKPWEYPEGAEAAPGETLSTPKSKPKTAEDYLSNIGQ